jgi:hypothetical protein
MDDMGRGSVSDELIADLLARVEAAERTIAQQTLIITDLTSRIMMLESESLCMDEVARLAHNVEDAFNQIARVCDIPESDVYERQWRRKQNE